MSFQMKKTHIVSVFPVGFSGGLKFEGPICESGDVVKWRAHYAPERYMCEILCNCKY